MKRQLESHLIKSIAYEPDTQTLEIEFRTGQVYAYARVPVETVDRLLAAESPGAFFNREIRNRFEFRKRRPHG